MMPTINFNTVTSDPLLLTAAALIIIGPVVFLVAIIQFVRAGKNKETFDFPGHEPDLNSTKEVVEEAPALTEAATPLEEPAKEEEKIEEPEPPLPTVRRQQPIVETPDADKTVVMPQGMGEVQGQLEIAFSQIKTLNKKVAQFESELETMSRNAANRLESNELKELPMNPADFTQKLLKLAEHVIVLEKEVARMKAANKSGAETTRETPVESAAQKPPIMPI